MSESVSDNVNLAYNYLYPSVGRLGSKCNLSYPVGSSELGDAGISLGQSCDLILVSGDAMEFDSDGLKGRSAVVDDG